MKPLPLLCLLGLAVSTFVPGRAAVSGQNTVPGKFVVTRVNGTATCVSDGRILELKKGDAIVGRGAVLTTSAKSNVVVVFSNGTGVYADENTRLQVDKFEQEFFAPNNNLRVEPSNSTTLAKLQAGRVVISTPRLLAGTSMTYQTAHASISIRGDKILIETSDKQTRVAMIAGQATVNARDHQGSFAAVGRRVETGQEAFIQPIVNSAGKPGVVTTVAEPAVTNSSSTAAASTSPSHDTETGRVSEVSGTVTWRQTEFADESPLASETPLRVGNLIATGDASRVHLQPFAGAIATVLPNSVVEVEHLGIDEATAQPSVVLALRAGTLVSTIDPATRPTHDYRIRTLQGTAVAHGTAFVTSVEQGGFTLATTADAVTFTTAAGASYEVAAGHVMITSVGRDPQPPIPLAQAVAATPGFAAVLQSAFATTVDLARTNIGQFPAGSTLNLLTQVAASAATALPNQAEAFVSEALSAIASPASALQGELPAATGALVHVLAAATPERSAQIAAAAARAYPEQAAVIAAAAAKGAPAQASQIATELCRVVLQADPVAGVSASSLQSAAALAAAVAMSTPNQAAGVAVATMHAVLERTSTPTPETTTRQGALIAQTVTRAAPDQAVPIARAMMQLLVHTLPEATPVALSRTAASLADAIIAVVPAQARPVATAVMQFLATEYPGVTQVALAEIASFLTETIAQSLPDRAAEVALGATQGTGSVTVARAQEPSTMLQPTAVDSSPPTSVQRESSLAFVESTAAAHALLAGLQLALVVRTERESAADAPFARAPAGFGGNGRLGATSIVITAFDPQQVSHLTSDLEAAHAATATVQFYSEATAEGGATVRPEPTIPRAIAVETIVSPSTIGL